MALRTTNITTALVRNALGEAVSSVFALCSSAKINKWSKYKPVRGANWPSADGKYGLDILLATLSGNWAYLPVRGGSPGGTPDEPGRIGDFRGYEPDPTLAFPSMHIKDSEKVIWTLDPKFGPVANNWKVRIYRSASDVLILPSDLGYDSYYVGIKISGDNVTTSYRTLFQVSAGQASGTDVYVDATYDEVTDSFADLPLGYGTYHYQFFISSAATEYTGGKYQWETDSLAGTVFLPHEGIYISNGSFVVTGSYTLYTDETEFDFASTPVAPGYQETVVNTKDDPFIIDPSYPSWLTVQVYDGTNEVNNPSFFYDGMKIRLTPSVNLTYSQRFAEVIVTNSLGGEEILYISQIGLPVPPAVGCERAEGETFLFEDLGGSIEVLTTQLTFAFTNLQGWDSSPGKDMDINIYDASNTNVYSGILEDVYDHSTIEWGATVTINRQAVGGDVFRVILGTAQ